MFFVPEYETFMGDKVKVTYSSKSQIHFLWENGQTTKLTRRQFEERTNLWKLKRITFECPYCQATLNQSERVKCDKCGKVIKAIDEELFQLLIEISIDQDRLKKEITYLEFYNFATMHEIYHINNIHWLEIAGGTVGRSQTV